MFYGCESLKEVFSYNFNPQFARAMKGMFYECKSLQNINFPNFKPKAYRCIYFNYMFHGCESLREINMPYVRFARDMFCMFQGCTQLEKIFLDRLFISSFTSMYHMFYGCNNLNVYLKGIEFTRDNSYEMFDITHNPDITIRIGHLFELSKPYFLEIKEKLKTKEKIVVEDLSV
jgi:hypothetical protein